jgi:hypothetical protein
LARFLWSHGRRFYNIQGLHAFKGKFAPAWEPRYLAASGVFGPYLALADIAVLIGGGVRRPNASRPRALKSMRHPVGAGILCLALAMSSLGAVSARALNSGDFGELHIVPPDGAMHGLVILFSDAKGWDAASDKIAAALAHDGASSPGSIFPPTFGRSAPRRTRDAPMRSAPSN